MKKIMFFIYSLRVGGSEMACIKTANALAGRYDVTVFTVFGNAGLENEVSPDVHLIHRFPRFIRGFAKILYALKPKLAYRLLIKEEYDIEIAVGDGLESFVISGSPNPNKYSWIHMNLGSYGTRKSDDAVKRFRSFKGIICVSRFNKEAFVKEMGIEENVRIAYTPGNMEALKERADEFEVSFDKKTLITVGRLEPVKGYDRLIDAVSRSANKDFDLLLIGNGTQKDKLQSLILQNGLNDRVKIIGTRVNPYPYIKAADALVCASLEESFGLAVIEAMTLGTPVISTRCGGVEEIILNPRQGMLCDNSVEGLQDAIELFLNGRCEINVDEAYKRACDFSTENCIQRFCEIIEEQEAYE